MNALSVTSLLSLVIFVGGCANDQTGEQAGRERKPPSHRDNTSRGPLPNLTWIQSRIAEYKAGTSDEMLCGGAPCGIPLEIWRVTYSGKPAFYFLSDCCDGFNTLFDEAGTEICSPDGGLGGTGAGDCKEPMEKRENRVVIWRKPSAQKPLVKLPLEPSAEARESTWLQMIRADFEPSCSVARISAGSVVVGNNDYRSEEWILQTCRGQVEYRVSYEPLATAYGKSGYEVVRHPNRVPGPLPNSSFKPNPPRGSKDPLRVQGGSV